MDLHLTHFRCYSDKKFHFPMGVILIDGPSGKGKSTILQAIKYALYGTVKNVCQYGEKKTSVRLCSLGLDILRTNIPSRLVVFFQEKMYEDLEAQEMIYKRFGRQFDITSYMAQKGTSQFFTLSGAEKLTLLEELSLSGDEKIQSMKSSIQTELKDVRFKFSDEQSQVRLLESQIQNPPCFSVMYGIKRVSDATELILFSQTLVDFWESQRKKIETSLSYLSKSMQSQLQTNQSLVSMKHDLKKFGEEKDSLEMELQFVNNKWSMDSLFHLKQTLEEHNQAVSYKKKQAELEEKTYTYQTLVQNETQSIEKQVSELQSQFIVKIEDPKSIKEKVSVLNAKLSICVRIGELEKEIADPKYNDIRSKWKDSTEKVEKVKQFLQDYETRKCVQSCPHCKKGLVIQSQKITSVDHQPASETDKSKEIDYKTKYPLLVKQTENYHKLMVSYDSMQVDLARLKKECESDHSTIQTELDTLLVELKQIQSHQFTNESITKQLESFKKQNPEIKYKDMKKKMDELQIEVQKLKQGQLHESIDMIMESIQLMEEAKREQDRLEKRKEKVEQCIVEKEKERLNVFLDETDYPSLIQTTLIQQSVVAEKWMESQKSLSLYKQYYTDISAYLEFRKKVKLYEEKKKRCILYQTRLEQLETLVKHIIEAESVCLEQFIRRINRTMAWYMEQFFPEGSLRMELDTERECKNGKIRQEICVQLTQNQFVCDLKALSGGEYDRCALAFMLTINELSHSPCLFLDESISSLDMILSEDVLEVIKEKQTELRKLVLLVSHQANTGFFDHVISL
jgi:DNA repair exonuclease SbcCD ATPase subunit